MNHQVQVSLVIVILLSLTIVSGLLVARAGRFTVGNLFTPTITGAAVAACTGENCPAPAAVCTEKTGTACRIACYEHTDCDDRIAATTDVCRNPGTEFSICVNK